MRRFALLTALACVLSIPALAATQAQAPAQPAKYIAPVKGAATIDVIQTYKRVGKEMVTVVKVRNTSKGALNLLKADEYWYDKNMKIVTGSQYSHRKAPIQPGEIVEFTMKSPVHPGTEPVRNQIMFRHAYGDAKATGVKSFK